VNILESVHQPYCAMRQLRARISHWMWVTRVGHVAIYVLSESSNPSPNCVVNRDNSGPSVDLARVRQGRAHFAICPHLNFISGRAALLTAISLRRTTGEAKKNQQVPQYTQCSADECASITTTSTLQRSHSEGAFYNVTDVLGVVRQLHAGVGWEVT